MQIVFFGTPDFAVASLRALLGEGFVVNAVVTRPDKPRGRSRSKLVPSEVKAAAEEEGIPVLQPDTPNTPEFIDQIRALQPDLGVVVAYGHILKPELLDVPRLGMINVHASLLPKFRGAAPIQRAILGGVSETGVSIQQMDAGMDTGPILVQIAVPVASDETFGELYPRLAELGALGIVEAVTMLQIGGVDAEAQDHERATYAPKIDRDTARVSWEASATEIARLVRAMDPVPGAWSVLDGNEVKLFGPASAGWPPTDAQPGQILDTSDGLVVTTAEGALRLQEVQPAGKKRMSVADWTRGRGPRVGQTFQ